MPQSAEPITPKRFLQLVAIALGIPLGVWLLLGASSGFYFGNFGNAASNAAAEPDTRAAFAAAQAEQRRGLVLLARPGAASGSALLQPGDEFFRQLRAGVQGDPGALGQGSGEGLMYAVQNFLHQHDVLAREVVDVREFGRGWTPFTGRTEAGWSETIHWCLRLRYLPGQEDAYAYSLWQLRNEAFGETLGLPEVSRDLSVTPHNGSQFLDPSPHQNLLLPISTTYRGDGGYALRAPWRSWQIEPESRICEAARAG